MGVSTQGRFRILAIALLVTAALPALALAQAPPPEPDAQANELDPESPLAPLPDIGVDWPDMGKDLPILEPLKPANPPPSDSATATPGVPSTPIQTSDVVGERRYRIVIEGLEVADRETIVERFNATSVLEAGDNKPANVAQIDRRAREDSTLMSDLLRAEGYYDGTVETSVDSSQGDTLIVKLIVEPGPLYRFSDVRVTGLEGTGDKAGELREVFAVFPEDAVDADDVLLGQANLSTELKRQGYPFSKVNDPDVVIDHDTRLGTLDMAVETGGQRNFGQILLTGNKLPFDAKHVSRIARFKPGEIYDQEMVDDLRRALIATGLVSQANVKPVPASDPALADIAVGLEPAPLRTIAAEAGYGTGEGIRAEVSWTHRNLIRPEGAVTFRGVAGTREQYLGATLRQSNFRKRDQVLNARIAASNIERSAYDARTLEIAGSLERQTNIIWQKKWTWSTGFELLASDERDMTKIANAGRKTFFIGALPFTLNYDGTEDLLDPTSGFRLGGRISPEVSFQGGTFTYVRAQIDGSYYQPFGKNIVLAGRARIGSIVGAGNNSIAPSRRFYSGGGGSVRGYGYQQIGPRDIANDPVGGRSLTEFALETRVRFGAFGVVPFLDGGNVYTTSLPKFSKFRLGAGIGGRYYSSFGPIRIDVGTPLNPQKGDPKVTVFVSLGQAF